MDVAWDLDGERWGHSTLRALALFDDMAKSRWRVVDKVRDAMVLPSTFTQDAMRHRIDRMRRLRRCR